MIKYPLFLIIGVTLTGLGIGMDMIARSYYLYGMYVWLDLIVHFITAFGLGFAVLWIVLFGRSRQGEIFSKRQIFGICIGVVLFAGVGWEVVEVLKGMERADNYIFDTTLDIIMDLLGALLASFAALWWQRRSINRISN